MEYAKQPDGDALIRAKRRNVSSYQKEIDRQIKLGFSYSQLAQAMAESRELIDALGPQRPPKRPRYGVK